MRDLELENTLSFSSGMTPPHWLSNTFHRGQESSLQTRGGLRSPSAAVIRRIDGQRRPDSVPVKPSDSHTRSTEELPRHVRGEDNLMGSPNQEQGDDTRIHLDESRDETLVQKVAAVFNENGKGQQHQKHYISFVKESDHESAKRMSDTIGETPEPPKRSNISKSLDGRNHLNGSRDKTLAQKVADVFDDLDFKGYEASDLVQQSFTQTTPSTVPTPRRPGSKTQFKRITIGRKLPKAAQPYDFKSVSKTVHSAEQPRRPEVRERKVGSAMHNAKIESSAWLRESLANGSAAADYFNEASDVAPAFSTVGTPLSQSLATTDVVAKPKADAIPNDHYYREASPVVTMQDCLGQAQAAESLKGPAGSHQGDPSLTVILNSPRHVDVDEDSTCKSTQALQNSEDEPLNVVRRRCAVPKAQMKAPEEVGRIQGPQCSDLQLSMPIIAHKEAGCDTGTLPKTNHWRSRERSAADDDGSLLKPLPQDERDVTYTASSLFDEWHEYDPTRQLDYGAKMAEIKRRPSRKAMFGKPAFHSRLGSREVSQSGYLNGIGGSSTVKKVLSRPEAAHSIDPFPVEPNMVYYDTLQESLRSSAKC